MKRGEIKMIWQSLIGQLMIVITLGLGALLISLFPILFKQNRFFGYFSIIMGSIIWLLLLWFVLGNPTFRSQLIHNGLQ